MGLLRARPYAASRNVASGDGATRIGGECAQARAKPRIFYRHEPTSYGKILDYCCIPYRKRTQPVHAVGFTQLLVYGAFIVLGIGHALRVPAAAAAQGARRARQSAQDHGQPQPALPARCPHHRQAGPDRLHRAYPAAAGQRRPDRNASPRPPRAKSPETSTPAPGRSPTGVPPPPSSIPCWNFSRSTSPSSAVSPCSGFAASSSFPTPSVSPASRPRAPSAPPTSRPGWTRS